MVYRWMHGWMDGYIYGGWSNGQTVDRWSDDGQMHGWMDGWIVRWIDGWMKGWIDGQMHGWRDEAQMEDGQMDRELGEWMVR